MDSLKSLVGVLRPSEKRLLLHYYSRNSNAQEKLRLKLYKIIEAGIEDDEHAKVALGSAGGASAYSHLKARLKEDILNVLLTQETSKRFAQANRAAELDCRKKVAQSHLLLLRGAQVEGMKVLNKALKTADRFELLAERLQINHLLREKFLGAGSSAELTRLNDAISKDVKLYEALLYVEEQSFILTSPEYQQKLANRAYDKRNLDLIADLGKLFQKHKLARIGFWYFMAATEYHTVRKNYGEVVSLGLKFLKLVEKSPAVKSKNNAAGVNQTLGFAFLQLRKFGEAQSHLVVSEKLFAASGFNRLQSLQLLVQSAMPQKEYVAVQKYVDVALSHPRIERREYLVPRWLFFKTSVLFARGDVDEAFTTLNRDGYLMKQQDEWNIQYRLLEMMILIEQVDEEWLEFKLDATRKFLTRHKNLDTPRVRAAVDVFSNILRKDLNFNELSSKNEKLLTKCLFEEQGYEWNPAGAELIRFDKWIESRRADYLDSKSDKTF